MLLTGSHPINSINLNRQKIKSNTDSDIYLCEGVWIASNSIIIGPCHIGKNSVVAAGSVVLPGHLSENSLYAGNPAIFIKKINID